MPYKNKGLEVELTDEQAEEVVKVYGAKKDYLPKEGQIVYYISLGLDVFPISYKEIMKQAFIAGEILLTKEEAEKKAEKLKALARINEYILSNGLRFKPDWSDVKQNYVIEGWGYHRDSPSIAYFCLVNTSKHNLVFKSAEDRQLVLDNCAEDLETLLKD